MLSLTFNTAFGRLAAVLALNVVAVGYSGLVLRAFWADQIATGSDSLPALSRACALEPGNAARLLALGRHYFRQPKGAGLRSALELYQQSLQRNPFNPWCWSQLSFLYKAKGDLINAEQAIQAAERLNPLSASMAVSSALLKMDQGRADEAMDRLRKALEYDPTSETEVFELCWDLELSPSEILERIIPPGPAYLLDYIGFLVNNEQAGEATAVWQRLLRQPQPFSMQGADRRVAAYIDALLHRHEPDKAADVWKQYVELSPERRVAVEAGNLVTNGGFDADLLNGGFDWRFVPDDHARVRLDTQFKQTGRRSLFIEFDGRENLKFQNVYQLIPVEPSTAYHFSASIRTEGITSDMGPHFEIRDYYASNQLLGSTDGLVGTHEWTEQALQITTGPDTLLLSIHIVRTPSWRLADRLEGRVWVDHVRLTRSQP